MDGPSDLFHPYALMGIPFQKLLYLSTTLRSIKQCKCKHMMAVKTQIIYYTVVDTWAYNLRHDLIFWGDNSESFEFKKRAIQMSSDIRRHTIVGNLLRLYNIYNTL